MNKMATINQDNVTERAQFKVSVLKEDVAKALELWMEATMNQGSNVRILSIGEFDSENMLALTATLIAKEQ